MLSAPAGALGGRRLPVVVGRGVKGLGGHGEGGRSGAGKSVFALARVARCRHQRSVPRLPSLGRCNNHVATEKNIIIILNTESKQCRLSPRRRVGEVLLGRITGDCVNHDRGEPGRGRTTGSGSTGECWPGTNRSISPRSTRRRRPPTPLGRGGADWGTSGSASAVVLSVGAGRAHPRGSLALGAGRRARLLAELHEQRFRAQPPASQSRRGTNGAVLVGQPADRQA